MSGGELRPRGLSEAERAALAALDGDGLVDLVRALVAVPSLDGEEDAAQRAVAAWLDAAGLSADVWDVDMGALAAHPHWSHEVERDHALGVVGWTGVPAAGRAGEHGGRDLQLNGHIDVVPAGDEAAWTLPPWSGALRDGRVYGRGAVDMKGGLVCGLAALKAVRDAGVPLRGRLSVASVVGEEDGGTGTLATILRGHVPDGAVIMEPTRLRLVTAQAGSLMFRLVVRGLSAHGCAREEGVSAVEEFLPLFAALRRLERQRCGLDAGSDDGAAVAADGSAPPPFVDPAARALFAHQRLPWPIEVGTLRAGDWASSVPSVLVAEGRYGVAVGEDLASARLAFERAVEQAAAADPWLSEHPPAVEWWGGRFEPAQTDPRDPVVAAVRSAGETLTGAAPTLEGVPYGADMRLLVNVAGVPAVLFGPGDIRVAHMPDEYVAVEELQTAARCLVVAALRFCGVA